MYEIVCERSHGLDRLKVEGDLVSDSVVVWHSKVAVLARNYCMIWSNLRCFCFPEPRRI